MAFTWDQSLATGSSHVDEQHKNLFRQVDALSQAMKRGDGRAEIGMLLDFLAEYAVRHFAEEERLMDELRCPAAAANKQAHNQFLATFTSLRRRFDEAGAGTTLVLEIHSMLCDWLIKHIRGIDVQLRDCSDPAKQDLVGSTA